MRTTKRKARKEAFEHGFRSNFEYMFSKELKKRKLKADYEPDKIKYEQPAVIRTYCPDWKIKENVYIETKGIFSAADRKKLLNVQRCNPNITVYMLFMSARNTLSRTSKTTYGDWCDKNGVVWADIRNTKKWRSWFK
jgi:hypothetical protein